MTRWKDWAQQSKLWKESQHKEKYKKWWNWPSQVCECVSGCLQMLLHKLLCVRSCMYASLCTKNSLVCKSIMETRAWYSRNVVHNWFPTMKGIAVKLRIKFYYRRFYPTQFIFIFLYYFRYLMLYFHRFVLFFLVNCCLASLMYLPISLHLPFSLWFDTTFHRFASGSCWRVFVSNVFAVPLVLRCVALKRFASCAGLSSHLCCTTY